MRRPGSNRSNTHRGARPEPHGSREERLRETPGTHIDRVQQASSDRRHSTRRHGRRGNTPGCPPAHPSLNLSTKDGSVALDQHIRELWHFILIGMFKPLNRVEPGTYQGLSCHAWFIVGPSNNFQVPKYSRLPRLRLRLPLQVQVCFVFDVS
jgi:hypothetical protein